MVSSSPFPPGRQAETALDLLRQAVRELESVPAETEQSFLHVGATLRELSARLREIKEKSAAAAAFMSGGEIPSLVEGLAHTLERMERHAADANADAALAIERFGLMRDGLSRIGRLMAAFQERVAALRMMKTLTTIQSAMQGRTARGFRDVAADIGKLSRNIQVKSAGVILTSRLLNADLEKALAMVRGLGAKQDDLGRVAADTIRRGIGSLAAMHEKCAGAAAGVSDRSGEMSREIGEVVVAMQFHDITRQQMQHARESLAELCSSPGGERGRECDRTADIGSVCELQAAQLTNTVAELHEAVATITANLRKVSRDAAAASAGAHELAGFADRVGRSSMGEIENGLATVAAVFAENVATNRELTRVMVSVTEAMEEIAAFLEDIDDIGSEIKLIALNAIIKAAQAGSGGAALSVIAQTVERQSEDICRQAAVITEAILGITAILADLREYLGGGTAADAREAELEAVRTDLGAFLGSLRVLSDTVMALLADADRAAGSLTAEVEWAITAVREQNGGTLVRDSVIPRLQMLALSARAERRARAETDAQVGVAAAAARYTMQSERTVHANFFAAAAGRGAAANDVHGLGENVELF